MGGLDSRRSPGTGRKKARLPVFRPVPGLTRICGTPTAHAVGYCLSPSGLAESPKETYKWYLRHHAKQDIDYSFENQLLGVSQMAS